MKKLLVNAEPYIRTYTQYAYPDMVMNNEITNGDLMVKAVISDVFDERWEKDAHEAIIELDERLLTVYENHKTANRNKHIYRKLEPNDEMIVRIDYQQFTNVYDSVGLFVDKSIHNLENHSKMSAVIGNFCTNYLMSFFDGIYTHISGVGDEKEYPIWLKIKNNGDNIEAFYALNKNEWISAGKKEIDFIYDDNEYIIGLFISMKDRQYYKWLFNNYIHICLDVKDASPMRFCKLMKRDSKNYSIHPLIKFSSDNYRVLGEYGIDLWKFIKSNINCKRYVEVYLNEKFVPGLEAYKKYDRNHESLVYGYDDEMEKIHISSIYQGKPIFISISKDKFEKAYLMAGARRISIYELYPNDTPYEFDIRGIVKQLNDYLSGVNPTTYNNHFITQEKEIFGIDCYNEILRNENTKNIFLSDIRISFLLTEHKKCMKDRIDYLIYKEYLSREECSTIIELINIAYKKSKKILNMILKLQKSKDDSIAERIWDTLKDVREYEIACYGQLISLLEKNVE
ncbi:MAG: hypothetical protein FWG91_06675 [Lachnospiraceae bacterium]|nr:hypothetical protein [Lachnospiraceae bacterium]